MNFTCEKNDIVNAVSVASKATTTKTTTQTMLSRVRVQADDGRVNICGNNSELAIETSIKADTKSSGGVALDAAMFGNFVRNMPDGMINITVDDDGKAVIKGGKVKFTLQGFNAQDFPDPPEIEKDKCISISQYTLKEIVRQVIFSAAVNDTEPRTTGICFDVEGDKLTLSAIDRHRIAVRKTDLRQMYENFKAVIPAKSLAEIVKVVSGDDVKIYFGHSQVAFDDGSTLITSRLIAGEYFDLKRMMQHNTLTTVKAKRDDLAQSIERSRLVAKESEKKPVLLRMRNNSIDVYAVSGIGDYFDRLSAEIDGPELTIGFNPHFLIDVLKTVDEEDITMRFGDSRAPLIVKDDAETYTYIVLPVNFKEQMPDEDAV